jgi:hypothetical protein
MIRSSARRFAALVVSATMLFPLPGGAVTFTPVSFQVSPTGAAMFEIPITTPPGTAGVAPKLSLAYSSQGGSVAVSGLSAISRCGRTIAQDNVNSGVHYDANDRYCMDGQRLVLVSGTHGAPGAVYRAERDDFTKIVTTGSAGSGPSSFAASTKSGLVLEFGATDDARIEADASRSDIRVWALNKIRDVKGNYMTITYAEDRTKSSYYPARIDYTGNATTGAVPYASVRFIYETRTDVSGYFIGGSLVSVDQRLTHVQTYVGDTLVRDYGIGYTYSSGDQASLATNITECAAGNVCLPPTTLGWQVSTGKTGFADPLTFAALQGDGKLASGDINGDSLADIAYTLNGHLYFQLSNGNGFGPAVDAGVWPTTQSPNAPWWSIAGSPQEMAVGDVNGDGFADVVAAGGQVWLSTGAALGAAVQWQAYPDYAKVGVGDVNGDGRGDLIYTDGTQLFYALSTGSSFSAPVTVGAWDQYSGVMGITSPAQLLVGDLSGDGLVDIVSGTRGIWLSNGSGFAARTESMAEAYGNALLALGDVNGDGLADLISIFTDNLPRPGLLSYQLSNGAQFTAPAYSAWDQWSYQGYMMPATPAVGDFNGDGRADVFSSTGSVRASNAITPNLVTTLTNGLGLTTTVTYKPASDSSVYTAGTGAAWPVRDLSPRSPLPLVASVSTPMGSSNYVTNYFYREGKLHVYGRGFLGFRFMDTSDPQTGIKTSTEFQQDWPYVGMAKQLVKKSGSGGILNQIDNSNACLQDGVACTPQSTRYFLYVAQSDELSSDLNGAFINKVRTNNSFDAYGNALQIVVEHLTAGGAASGYKKVTTNTYFAPDTANWILGRLQRSTVASTAPDVSVPANPGGVAAGDPVGTPASGISIPALMTIIQTLLLD